MFNEIYTVMSNTIKTDNLYKTRNVKTIARQKIRVKPIIKEVSQL